MSILRFRPRSNPFNPKYAIWVDSCGQKAIFRLFLALAPVGPHLGHFGSCKRAKLVCVDVIIVVPTLFNTFQPKIGPLGRFVWQRFIFLAYESISGNIIDFLSPMQYWCGGIKAVCHVPHYTVLLVLVTEEDTRRTIKTILLKKLPWQKMSVLPYKEKFCRKCTFRAGYPPNPWVF